MNDYEIVREAVLGMYLADQDGLYGFKDDALAALDRILAENERLEGVLRSASEVLDLLLNQQSAALREEPA